MPSDRFPADNIDVEAGNAWTRFWFTPAPTTGLHALRVLAGVLFCAWLLSFMGHERAFFSLDGWFDKEAYQEAQRQTVPMAPLGWSILYLADANTAHSTFLGLYWSSIAVLVLFTLGVATRITSVLTWVVVVSFLGNPAISYEADYLLAILAFYLMFAYLLVGHWNGGLTIWEQVLGSPRDLLFGSALFGASARERPLSYAANGVMRLVQLHFAIIIVTSGLHKLQMGDWWAGVALWYPLHPPFLTTAESLQREAGSAIPTLFVLSLIQYAALAWQIGFPLFAWRTGWWRGILLGGALLGWLGVFFIYKMPLFGPFVMLCSLSYLTPNEWARLGSFGRQAASAVPSSKTSAEPKKSIVLAGNENIKKF